MTVPASMDLLTGTMARCIRHCRGTTGDGTAEAGIRGAGTIPISGWRCASLRVSNTRQVQILPAPTWRRQKQWRNGLMRRRWSCSPCSVKSTALTRLRMASSSAIRKGAAGALPATTATRNIYGRSLAWGTRWTDSVKRSRRQWVVHHPARMDTPRLWEMPWQQRSRWRHTSRRQIRVWRSLSSTWFRCTFQKGKRKGCGAMSPLRSPALRPGNSVSPALRSHWIRTTSAAWA